MIVTILYGLIVLSFMTGAFILYRSWNSQYIDYEEKKNSDKSPVAEQGFIDLLNDAEERLDIYDDGNDMKMSIYQSNRVIKKVKKKLDLDTNFSIRCLFNSDDPTEFRLAFGEGRHKQVTIITRQKPHPKIGHYKIIDGGKKAYLSWHSYGDENRKVRIYDFSRVKKPLWGQEDMKERYLGVYLKDIEENLEGVNA